MSFAFHHFQHARWDRKEARSTTVRSSLPSVEFIYIYNKRVYTYIYICVCSYMCICMHVYIYVYIRTCTCMYMGYVHVHTSTMHAYKQMCISIYLSYLSICLPTYPSIYLSVPIGISAGIELSCWLSHSFKTAHSSHACFDYLTLTYHPYS